MKLARRLDRYVISEVLGPLVLGFLVYTFIILAQFLLQSAEMIVRRGVPAGMVGRLLLLSLPNIVVLTVPMSFLFAILVAVGRFSADSELIAMRSSGVSLLSLYRPILLLSLLLTLFNTYLMVTLLPAGNNALQRLRIDIVTESINKQVEPRVFYDEWTGFVLYVWDSPTGEDVWNGVFLAESKPGQDTQLTIASQGRVQVGESGERVLLELTDAVTHKVDLDRPEKYHVIRHESLERLVEERFSSNQRGRQAASKGLREKTISELRRDMRDPDFPIELVRLAEVEIHKKFSLPAACLVFGLIALPLGFNSKRGGSRSSSFALSIIVILFYWVLLNNGEEAARVGKMAPWLAMWLPNILLAVFGLYLLARRNSDKSLLLRNVDRWIQEKLWRRIRLFRISRESKRESKRRRRASVAAPGGTAKGQGLVLRLPRLRWWMPSLIDRYIFRLFSLLTLLVLFALVVVFIIGDLTEIADDLLSNEVPGKLVLRYYRYLAMQATYELSPVVVLVATLITFGLLSRSNEIIACRAVGISLYRISVPAIIGALLVTLGSLYLQAEVLPSANRKIARMKDQIKGREKVRTYRRADRQWLFGQGRYIYYFQNYDPEDQSLHQLQVLEFDDDVQLVKRLYVTRANYLGEGSWRFDSGWLRTFEGSRVASFETFDEPVVDRFPETPSYFESDLNPPDQMSYGELDAYIDEIKLSGQAVPEMETELYAKIAYPVASVVMALVALPFAFRMERKGALYGVGISIVLGMVFIALYQFATTLGQTGALPPLIAVWSLPIVFGFLSIYLFLGVRT